MPATTGWGISILSSPLRERQCSLPYSYQLHRYEGPRPARSKQADAGMSPLGEFMAVRVTLQDVDAAFHQLRGGKAPSGDSVLLWLPFRRGYCEIIFLSTLGRYFPWEYDFYRIELSI